MGCSNIVRLTPPNLLGRKAEEIKAITVAECRERRRGMDGKPDLVPPLLPPPAVPAWLFAFGLSSFASSRLIGAMARASVSDSESPVPA